MDCHVDYFWIIVMFLSALILTAPIHCRGSIGEQVMLNSPNLFWRKNKLTDILYGMRVSKISANFLKINAIKKRSKRTIELYVTKF